MQKGLAIPFQACIIGIDKSKKHSTLTSEYRVLYRAAPRILEEVILCLLSVP